MQSQSLLLTAALLLPIGCQSSVDQPEELLEQIAERLREGRIDRANPFEASAVRQLRADPERRGELIRLLRDHAPTGAVSLTTEDEPGAPLRVELSFVDRSGAPLADALVLLFQTGADGRYAPEAGSSGSGERNARLAGWVRSDAEGHVVVRTIVPGAYGGAPPHWHISVRPSGGEPIGTRIYFDAGVEPVHPEIRSDAAEGVAWLLPLEKAQADSGWTASGRVSIAGH